MQIMNKCKIIKKQMAKQNKPEKNTTNKNLIQKRNVFKALAWFAL